MARIRTIKPEFFRHEALFEAERQAKLPLRLAFAGLFTAADRQGRFRWQPRVLKLDCLPFDEVDFANVLDALAEQGFIVKYEFKGECFGHIPSWGKHQHINQREAESAIPAPDQEGVSMCMHVQTHGEGKGREGERKGKEISLPSGAHSNSGSSSERESPQVLQVFEHWQQTHNRKRSVLDAKRRKRILDGLKHFTAEQLCDSISGYLDSPHHMGTDPRGNGVRYDDIELFLRDTQHIETGLRLKTHPPRPPPKPETATERLLRLNSPDNSRVIEHDPEELRAISNW